MDKNYLFSFFPAFSCDEKSILPFLSISSDAKTRYFQSAQSPSFHVVTVQSMILTVTFHYQVRFVS